MPEVVIPVVALLIPIIVVPTALGIRFARRVREMEHLERIKALELGRTLPGDEPWCNPARISLAIGAGVPVGVFLCGGMASQVVGFHEEIWIGATLVGLGGVICGSILASKHFAHRAYQESLAQNAYPKAAVDDADAYDVVGRRG